MACDQCYDEMTLFEDLLCRVGDGPSAEWLPAPTQGGIKTQVLIFLFTSSNP